MNQHVLPKKLLECGFTFNFPNIEICLEDLLGANNLDCAVMERKQWISADKHRVWTFFSDEKNLEKITPEFLQFKVEGISTEEIEEGTLLSYKLKIHGIPVKWRSKIINFFPEDSFQDTQLSGPYRTWLHTHRFDKLGEGTLIRDYIKYKVPLGKLGGMFIYPFVKKDVEKIFKYRKKKITELFFE